MVPQSAPAPPVAVNPHPRAGASFIGEVGVESHPTRTPRAVRHAGFFGALLLAGRPVGKGSELRLSSGDVA
jgi:hypothetical protein